MAKPIVLRACLTVYWTSKTFALGHVGRMVRGYLGFFFFFSKRFEEEENGREKGRMFACHFLAHPGSGPRGKTQAGGLVVGGRLGF